MIGTGPFLFSEFNDGPPKSVILVKNMDYYMKDKEGNALPYLDKIELIFENRKLEQLDLFESHTTDLILGCLRVELQKCSKVELKILIQSLH